MGLLDELGITIDPQLYRLALTHRSYAYEHGGLPTNERLEFLGDSVLGIIVTETLYRSYPDRSEGQLAKLRAAVVNSRALARVGRALQLGGRILLGKGELTTGGRDKASILADTVEAVIGAIYLSHGLDGARAFVHHIFDPMIVEAVELGAGLDWKTSLQELASNNGYGVPSYELVGSGPDHAKKFEATVVLGDLRFGPGRGRNKKQAEQEAAAIGFQALNALQAEAVTPLHEDPEEGLDGAEGDLAAEREAHVHDRGASDGHVRDGLLKEGHLKDLRTGADGRDWPEMTDAPGDA